MSSVKLEVKKIGKLLAVSYLECSQAPTNYL